MHNSTLSKNRKIIILLLKIIISLLKNKQKITKIQVKFVEFVEIKGKIHHLLPVAIFFVGIAYKKVVKLSQNAQFVDIDALVKKLYN